MHSTPSDHRKLEVNVGILPLWAIGVGAFIGGDFVGWPSVLEGGFGSGIVAVLLMAVYFWMIGKAAGDLSSRFREPGGTYMFCRKVYGMRISPFIAIMQTLKLLISNCCMALAISSYMQQILYRSKVLQIGTWFFCYVICTALDVIGIKLSARVQIFVVLICLLIMFIYFIAAIILFDFHKNSLGDKGWFYNDFNGFLISLPFGMWFLDGFEELPLAISFANDSSKTVPIAMNLSWITAVVIALGLLLFGSASTPLNILLEAPAPLMFAFKQVWGSNGFITIMLDISIILGLIVTFYAFVFFIGQTVQAISCDHILPSFMATLHPVYGTASNASIISSIIGFLATFCFGIIFGESSAQKVLIVCSLLTAVICYFFIFGCLSIILDIEYTNNDNNETNLMNSTPIIPSTSSSSRTFGNGSMNIPTHLELGICGHDPGSMRFPLGRIGARFGQVLSVLLLLCTLNLATNHKDYRVGVLLMFTLCLTVFLSTIIYNYIQQKVFGITDSEDTVKKGYLDKIICCQDASNNNNNDNITNNNDHKLNKLENGKDAISISNKGIKDDSMWSFLYTLFFSNSTADRTGNSTMDIDSSTNSRMPLHPLDRSTNSTTTTDANHTVGDNGSPGRKGSPSTTPPKEGTTSIPCSTSPFRSTHLRLNSSVPRQNHKPTVRSFIPNNYDENNNYGNHNINEKGMDIMRTETEIEKEINNNSNNNEIDMNRFKNENNLKISLSRSDHLAALDSLNKLCNGVTGSSNMNATDLVNSTTNSATNNNNNNNNNNTISNNINMNDVSFNSSSSDSNSITDNIPYNNHRLNGTLTLTTPVKAKELKRVDPVDNHDRVDPTTLLNKNIIISPSNITTNLNKSVNITKNNDKNCSNNNNNNNSNNISSSSQSSANLDNFMNQDETERHRRVALNDWWGIGDEHAST